MAFKEKVVLITGGSSGIGAACAETFAQEGALLALVGRNADKFLKVLPDIRMHSGENQPLIIIADVVTDSKRIINETIRRYGRLDVLVNNAGIIRSDNIVTADPEHYEQVMNINVRGVLALTQTAVPYLLKSKGNIVNVSSIAGICAFSEYLIYCMSKAALDQFTKCVALFLAGKGVRVNSVNPGVVPTNIFDASGMDETGVASFFNFMRAHHPIGRLGRTDEIAEVVAFLASDKASFVTGICMPVDGGVSINDVN